jgi:hypothetical protein
MFEICEIPQSLTIFFTKFYEVVVALRCIHFIYIYIPVYKIHKNILYNTYTPRFYENFVKVCHKICKISQILKTFFTKFYEVVVAMRCIYFI